jgi:hypothetical protein
MYKKLELEDTILLFYPPSESVCKKVGGIFIEVTVNSWFYRPQFVSQLPTPTWGALRKFVRDNLEELEQLGTSVRPNSIFDSSYENIPDEVELLKPARIPANSGFSLFEEDEGGKPTVVYDGFYEYRNESFLFYYYLEERAPTSDLMAHNYVPAVFKFYSMPKEKTKRYFGLELEVNTDISWSDLHKVLTEVHPVQEDLMYFMHDGSISGDKRHSYEIVTHPMTPRRMRKEFTLFFSKLEKLLKPKGKSLSDVFDITTDSTGIHIHVSRDSFRASSRTHLNKFAMVWNSNVPAMVKLAEELAGRTLRGHRYSPPSHQYEGRSLSWCLKNHHTSGRYVACNLTQNTVEVRAFKGTPSLSNILKCIDAVEAVIDFTYQAPHSVFNRHFKTSFMSWINEQNKTRYRTLREKMKCA